MELPGNSNSSKEKSVKQAAPDEPKEDLKPLPLSGEAIRKKKPLGQKFRDVFFGGDFKGTMKTVASVTVAPAIRNLVFDTGVEALKRTIFPNMAPGTRPSSQSLASRITYHTPVNRDPREDPRSRDPRMPQALPGGAGDVGDIGLPLREDAEMVLDGLIEKIDRHRFATVRDLYTLLGWPTNYTDEYRGWSQLGEVQIIQTREGYILRLPRTEVR